MPPGTCPVNLGDAKVRRRASAEPCSAELESRSRSPGASPLQGPGVGIPAEWAPAAVPFRSQLQFNIDAMVDFSRKDEPLSHLSGYVGRRTISNARFCVGYVQH